jgi:hypothetical protein
MKETMAASRYSQKPCGQMRAGGHSFEAAGSVSRMFLRSGSSFKARLPHLTYLLSWLPWGRVATQPQQLRILYSLAGILARSL